MNDGPASARQRKSWQLRGASSPGAPVVLDGRSARGLLALLEGLEGDDARGVREQLASALEQGNADAIRAAMDLKPERHWFDLANEPQIVRFMNMTGG